MKIGVVGLGEVGSSIASLYKSSEYELCLFDPNMQHFGDLNSCDILNICIPYSDQFVNIVNSYIENLSPNLVIIHSSVSPGTTRKVNGKVCYSPIRGTHPNLEEGIRTFLKYVGSENAQWSIEYQNHLNRLGIDSYGCKDSTTAELAKLLDTTYYGLCIAFHNEVNKMCTDFGVQFDEVMTKFNESYNDGYTKLKKLNVIRPVLVPGDKIGGHCIIPNAKILKNSFHSPLINAILDYE